MKFSSNASLCTMTKLNSSNRFILIVKKSLLNCLMPLFLIAFSLSSNAQGNALNFDGTNDYVSTALNIAGGSTFTIEFWINPSSTTYNRRIISSISGPTTYAAIMFDAGKVQYWNGTVWSDLSTQILPIGKWSHVAVASTGTQVTGFINGVQQLTSSSNAAWQALGLGNPFLMMYGDYFQGLMDEVRIWNTAKTQAQIQANMFNTISPSSTGLLAYYGFDHGTAGATNTGVTTLTDLTSNAKNGTLNGFALSGSTSNWAESYAMVVPTATAATGNTGYSFTANWTAPVTGTVDNGYRLDVSTSSTFTSFVTGYNGLTVAGTSKLVNGLNLSTTYYYRVRADKTTVTGQGGYSATITAATTAVPVSITNFKAVQKNNGVQVEWNTANEINMAAYEVEKSVGGTTFTKSGTVAAMNASSYSWLDASPINGSNYYRIKLVEKDGSFKYTQTVNVKIGGIKNSFTVAGNPIKNNTITLQIANVEKGNYTVIVFNNLGQAMATKSINHAGGSATETIALGNVTKGSYQLTVIGSNVKETRTVVVE